MQITSRQNTRKTLADLYRALDRRHAVTITYIDSKGDETIRTIEIHELHAKDGDIEIIAMCRLRGVERKFDVSGVVSYTVHRMAYVLERPAPTKYERPAPAPTDSADALYLYELAMDPDDADYVPRKKLTQTDTGLAA
jgi:predicted DNA-binding transcriptional regulator YafY